MLGWDLLVILSLVAEVNQGRQPPLPQSIAL